MTTSIPFLPARDNPLNMETVNQVPFRFPESNWDSHLDRLRDLNFRAAIVGAQGSGKSTLLRELRDQLSAISIHCHYVFLPHSRQQQQTLLETAHNHARQKSVLLVDGVERLQLIQRWDLYRTTKSGGGLIVTTHQPAKFPFTLPIWVLCQTSPGLLSSILTDLNLNHPQIHSAGQLAFKKHGGNIRDALRELYDQFASEELIVE